MVFKINLLNKLKNLFPIKTDILKSTDSLSSSSTDDQLASAKLIYEHISTLTVSKNYYPLNMGNVVIYYTIITLSNSVTVRTIKPQNNTISINAGSSVTFTLSSGDFPTGFSAMNGTWGHPNIDVTFSTNTIVITNNGDSTFTLSPTDALYRIH